MEEEGGESYFSLGGGRWGCRWVVVQLEGLKGPHSEPQGLVGAAALPL